MDISTALATDHVIVRPVGTLGRADAAALRAVIVAAATEQPDALVLDLREACAEPAALAVLDAVAGEIAAWPACPLVLIAVPGPLLDGLSTLGVLHRLTVLPDTSRVSQLRPWGHVSHRRRQHLPANLSSPGRARGIVTEALTAWNCREHLTEAMLVVDELVTNAVEHAGSDVDLYLSVRDGRLALAVGDSSTRPARLRESAVDDEGGRGLVLVDALADGWGTVPGPDHGKIVWARFRA